MSKLQKTELSTTGTSCQPNFNAERNARRVLRQFHAWHGDPQLSQTPPTVTKKQLSAQSPKIMIFEAF
jgi:hypothetical protein